MATVPSVPSEAAGTISASADWNAWAGACTYLLGSGTGANPMFFIMASSGQTFTTSASMVNFSNSGAVFKDNDSGFSSGSPNKYTIKTAGFWTVDWTVSAGNSASNVAAFLQITTSSANLYNPSATIKLQYVNALQTSLNGWVTSGGLIPIYLFPNDILQIVVTTGASSTEASGPYSHFSGHWVSE